MQPYLTAESLQNMNNVAIIFDDLTEFHVMRPIIDRLKKERIDIDIIIPYDSGYNGLAEHTIRIIKEFGYKPKNDIPNNKKYKILLTPYPGLEVVKRTNFIYHIQYPYGAISSKPYPTLAPGYRIEYDALFSFSTYDTDLLNACGSKVFTVPYWRYSNFKKIPNKLKKPILLILPTFGTDTSCIQYFTDSSISNLKKHYHVITKAHHAVHFNLDGKDYSNTLRKIADESYDSDTPIDELLQRADIVLSDNSGAIFESICAGIPTVLFAKDLNSRHLGTVNTPQYDFTNEGFFPYTNNPDKLLQTLSSAKKYRNKQTSLKKQLFLEYPKDPLGPFVNVIKTYLKSDPKKDYRKAIHRLLVEEWKNHERTIREQEQTIAKLNKEIQDLHNSTSWKITKPLRNIKEWRKK